MDNSENLDDRDDDDSSDDDNDLDDYKPSHYRDWKHRYSTRDSDDSDDECEPMKKFLKHLEGQDVLFVLSPQQLSILGQVCRPIMVATLKVAKKDYVYLENVNVRFSSAPEFVFPVPLYVPRPGQPPGRRKWKQT